MKAIFISYNQAYNEEIVEILDANKQRGFTRWEGTQGRGGVDGEPHYGNHAWPTMNHTIHTIVEDEAAKGIMSDLKAKDEMFPDLGLRAFSWDIESAI